jgi:MFS family permease
MMAWYTAAISSGYAVGALLGAESIRVFDYGGAFLASSILALAGAVLSLALRPPSELEPARSRPHIGKASRQNQSIRTIVALPAGVWLATLLAFYINFASDTYHTFFPIYAILCHRDWHPARHGWTPEID